MSPGHRPILNGKGSQINLTPKNPGDLNDDWRSFAPSWSTDGRQIYFTTRRPSTGLDTEVFVMNRDGTGPTNITRSADVDADPHVR